MANEIDHIAELEKKLYARDPESIPKRKFGILRPLKDKTVSTWGQTTLPPRERSVQSVKGYKRFFFLAFVFFLIAVGFAAFSYFRGAQTLSSKNVSVEILGSSFTGGGDAFPLQITIGNKNSADLAEAMLVITYPKGATDTSGGDLARIEKPIGIVGSGKTTSEAFSVVLYGEQGSTRTISAVLSYKLTGSSATFEKSATFPVVIRSSPVSLVADMPSAVVANQPFTLSIRTAFSGDTTLNNAVLRVEYPSGFVFSDAERPPTYRNNVWLLGDLQRGATHTITIHGKITGQLTDEKAFRIYVGTPEGDISSSLAVTYNSTLATLTITEPFITTKLLVNGQSDDTIVLPVGTTIQGIVSWQNTSPLRIASTVFSLALSGESIDMESVRATNGYVDPETKTLSWNGSSERSIATLEPQTDGELSFSFATKQEGITLRDIVLALSVTGAFPDRDNVAQSITNASTAIIKFAAPLKFASDALYSIGPIKNVGPYPPKANTETTYTVTWTLTPTTDPFTQLVASALLPIEVVWGGVIIPQGELIAYNPGSRLITWTVDALPQATPGTQKIRTVSFQVKAKPTKAQLGNQLVLLGETTVTGTDMVTGTMTTVKAGELTTRLEKDPLYTRGAEVVVP